MHKTAERKDDDYMAASLLSYFISPCLTVGRMANNQSHCSHRLLRFLGLTYSTHQFGLQDSQDNPKN